MIAFKMNGAVGLMGPVARVGAILMLSLMSSR